MPSLRPRKESAPSVRKKRYGPRSGGAYYVPSRNANAGLLPKCPKCGSQLKLRNGLFGMFIGCSKFPSCRYTREVNSGTR